MRQTKQGQFSRKPQDERSDSWGSEFRHPQESSAGANSSRGFSNCSFFRAACCCKIRPSDEWNHSTQALALKVQRPERRGLSKTTPFVLHRPIERLPLIAS